MSTTAWPRPRVRRRTFLVGFGVIALLIAGVLSYIASSSPDGLDSATQQGCQTVTVNGTEELTGSCIAQHATDHGDATQQHRQALRLGHGGDRQLPLQQT